MVANNKGLMDSVLFEEWATEGRMLIGVITLNSEKNLNALSLTMVNLLDGQLRRWKESKKIALVVLQAAGDRAFCAGGDVQSLYRALEESTEGQSPNQRISDFFEHEYRLNYLLHTYPKPIVSWGHGIIMGGGIGLTVGTSHRVVTVQSRLAMPEITIGLYPDVAGTWFLRQMPGALGLFLGLTGANIGAKDALFAKLADYCIAQEQKETVFASLSTQAWQGNQEDHVILSRVLSAAEVSSAAAFADLPTPLQDHYALIGQFCRLPSLTATVASILNHKSEDQWLQRAILTLKEGSPTSAALIYALQQRGRHRSLAEILRIEYGVTLHCCTYGEFREGVRALLIDKDRAPQWQPATLAGLNDSYIDTFFSDFWRDPVHPLADLQ